MARNLIVLDDFADFFLDEQEELRYVKPRLVYMVAGTFRGRRLRLLPSLTDLLAGLAFFLTALFRRVVLAFGFGFFLRFVGLGV